MVSNTKPKKLVGEGNHRPGASSARLAAERPDYSNEEHSQKAGSNG